MRTNDILSKFQSNNSKLETVLYKKKLPGDIKNLLLNMLYNITSSYNDYMAIKVNVQDKNEFVDNIVHIVEKCENIELIKPSSSEGKEFLKLGITCKVNTYFRTIKVFPTERDMLFALFKMNDTKIFLDEKYDLIRIALPEMLNEGRDINNIEIIRDFNAWSWNTLASEISNIDCNLIYQNLLMLLGFKFLDNWMKIEHQKDMLEKLEDQLMKFYNETDVKELLNLIYRLSILVCIERNENEKKRLLDEKEWDEKEYERLKNKKELVKELTDLKKEKAKEINEIDKIINDDVRLLKEFDKRNKELSEYKKIFSPENLLGTLKKERKKALKEIEEANELLDAKKYLERKKELEKKLDILKETKRPKNFKNNYKIKIQKLFIKCMKEKIESITSSEQIRQAISIMHILRYYNFIFFDEEHFIGEVEELREDLEELQGRILLKLYEIKALNYITRDLETDIGIIKPIFDTRIIDLENVVIQCRLAENKIEVEMYDGKSLELEFTLENLNNVDFKGKKKLKMFAKKI